MPPKIWGYDVSSKIFELDHIKMVFGVDYLTMSEHINGVYVYKDSAAQPVAVDLPKPMDKNDFLAQVAVARNVADHKVHLYAVWTASPFSDTKWYLTSYDFDPASLSFSIRNNVEFKLQNNNDYVSQVTVAPDGSAFMEVYSGFSHSLTPTKAMQAVRTQQAKSNLGSGSYALVVQNGVSRAANLWDQEGRPIGSWCKAAFDEANYTYIACNNGAIYKYQGIVPSETKPVAAYSSNYRIASLGIAE